MLDADNNAYAVSLDAFAGPLDLLLHLVRRAEVDIADIPIAEIADQFLAHVEQAERLDVDAASDFLVMAATLMELKSRLLAPASTAAEEASQAEDRSSARRSDPRGELVQQLLAYQWARSACDALEGLWERWSRRWPTAPAHVERAAVRQAVAAQRQARELEELQLSDLTQAYEAVLARVDFTRVGAHHVQLDALDEPIEVHAERLVAAVRERQERDGAGASGVPLKPILDGCSKAEVVGLFLALLELLRDGQVAIVAVEGDAQRASLMALRVALIEPSEERAPSSRSTAERGEATATQQSGLV